MTQDDGLFHRKESIKCEKCGKELGNGYTPKGGYAIMTSGNNVDFEFYLCYDCWNKVERFVRGETDETNQNNQR